MLQEAHAAASTLLRNRKDPQEYSGASTAVVLSLVSRPEDGHSPEDRKTVHSLHEYVYGDTRSPSPVFCAARPFSTR